MEYGGSRSCTLSLSTTTTVKIKGQEKEAEGRLLSLFGIQKYNGGVVEVGPS